MLQNTSRPHSVLITQVILICLGGLWLVGGPLFLLASIKSPAAAIVYLVSGSVMILSSTAFLVGFWGLVKRKSYGRWIGVIGMSLLLLSIFIGNVFPSSGLSASSDNNRIAESAGAMIASVVFYAVIIFLIYRLAWGRRANAFFAGEAAPAQ
jgi:hypothetical protein